MEKGAFLSVNYIELRMAVGAGLSHDPNHPDIVDITKENRPVVSEPVSLW